MTTGIDTKKDAWIRWVATGLVLVQISAVLLVVTKGIETSFLQFQTGPFGVLVGHLMMDLPGLILRSIWMAIGVFLLREKLYSAGFRAFSFFFILVDLCQMVAAASWLLVSPKPGLPPRLDETVCLLSAILYLWVDLHFAKSMQDPWWAENSQTREPESVESWKKSLIDEPESY